MTSEREAVAFTVVLGGDGDIDVQPMIVRAYDPMGEKQPPEVAAQMLNLPLAEIQEALNQGLIPSTQDASGVRVVALRDVVEGVRRLGEAVGRSVGGELK